MILDAILVGIVAVNVLVCFKKGFTRSLFNMFSAILGVLLAILFYDKFSSFVKGSKYGVLFTDKIENAILNHYNSGTQSSIQNSDIPNFLKGFIEDGAKSLEEAVGLFAQQISSICITVLSIILLIVIIKLALYFVPKLLKTICKLPVIKQFDKLAGVIFGIISGIIWCVIIVYVLRFACSIPKFEFLNIQLDTSFFLQIVSLII